MIDDYIVPIRQGNMKPLTSEDQQRDNIGFTNVNLHHRIDPHTYDEEFQPRDYDILISSTHEFRTIETFPIDFENNEAEIP